MSTISWERSRGLWLNSPGGLSLCRKSLAFHILTIGAVGRRIFFFFGFVCISSVFHLIPVYLQTPSQERLFFLFLPYT